MSDHTLADLSAISSAMSEDSHQLVIDTDAETNEESMDCQTTSSPAVTGKFFNPGSGKYDLLATLSDVSDSSDGEDTITPVTSSPATPRIFRKSPEKALGRPTRKRKAAKSNTASPESGSPTPLKRQGMETTPKQLKETESTPKPTHEKTKALPLFKNGKGEKPSLAVYTKAIDGNIVKDVAFRKAKQFRQELCKLAHGDVKVIEAKADSLRVICFTAVQADTLLKANGIMGIPVKVTRPWSHNKKPLEPKPFRGVILNVDLDFSEQEIAEETGALTAKRIIRVEGGQQVKTTTVALTFKDEPPKMVYVGFYRFRVCHYIPAPIRCGRCQRFGHPTSACHSKQPRCVRCGEAHSFDDCPKKAEGQPAHCANCGGNHSAAYRGCRRYQQVREALKIVGKERVSYADAVKRQKQEAKKTTPLMVATPTDPPQSSSTVAPLPATGSYATVVTTPPQTKQAKVAVVQQKSAVKQQKAVQPMNKATAPIASTSSMEPAVASAPLVPAPVDDRIDQIVNILQVVMSLLLQMVKKTPTEYEIANLIELTKSVTKLTAKTKETTAPPQSSSSSSSSSTPVNQTAAAQPAVSQ